MFSIDDSLIFHKKKYKGFHDKASVTIYIPLINSRYEDATEDEKAKTK